MLRYFMTFFVVLSVVFVFAGGSSMAEAPFRDSAEEKVAKRITTSELKRAMRGSKDIVIIDMRAPGAYLHSELRIPGDVRIAYNDLKKDNPLLPEDKGVLIATYCT